MLFIPLLKVDAARRIIIARLDETPDRANMVLDYDSSKPAFLEWSQTMQKASGGLSYGNVREMHGLKAAGRVVRLDCLDAEKAFEFEIEVLDDDTMLKVETGVLTGISQGGKYGRKWRDGPYTRYTAGKINELSIVDLPCNPGGAVMLKADGTEVALEFVDGGLDAQSRYVGSLLVDAEDLNEYRQILTAQGADMLKVLFPEAGPDAMLKRDYDAQERLALAAKGEAMDDGSFPIAARADVEIAVSAHGYAADQAAAQTWITERALALEATDLLPEGWAGSTMQKGLGNVSRLAELLECLTWLVSDATWEASAERDGSKVPAQLAAWVKQGTVILNAMSAEETSEAMAALQAQVDAIPIDATIAADMEKAAPILDMAKAIAGDAGVSAFVQSIHDQAAQLGACCAHDGGGLTNMVKIAGDLASTRALLADVTAERDDMQKRIHQLEGLPEQGGPARTSATPGAVSKGADHGQGQADKTKDIAAEQAAIDAMPDGPDKTTALVRLAMKS